MLESTTKVVGHLGKLVYASSIQLCTVITLASISVIHPMKFLRRLKGYFFGLYISSKNDAPRTGYKEGLRDSTIGIRVPVDASVMRVLEKTRKQSSWRS
jgi:hypothetical protein